MHTILPLISTCFIAISAVFVAMGWYRISRGDREAHQKLMKTGALFALLFFIVYMSRTVLVGNTLFSETAPAWIRDAYYVFLLFHIVLAAVSAVFGIITLLHAYGKRFAKHRKIGRYTAVMWLVTAPTGIMVYVLLYLLYPGGTTKPVFDVLGKIFGTD
jgi:putative membrane protein